MEDLTLVSLINSFIIFIQNIGISLGFFKLHPPIWLKKLVNIFINLISTIFDFVNATDEFDAPSKLVLNCIVFPLLVIVIGQVFTGGFTIMVMYLFIIPFGVMLGLGIMSLVLDKIWLTIAMAAGSLIILIFIQFCCINFFGYFSELMHIPKSYFLGLIKLFVSALFIASGLAVSGVIKKYESWKEILFPTVAVIHFIIAAFLIVYAIFRITECGARMITRIKAFMRLNATKVIFITLNAIYLPIYQTIINSMMTIKDVCPNGSNPYAYNPRTKVSVRYFSCLYNDNITSSNNVRRFRYNLATTTDSWKYDMAFPITYCIILNMIIYPVYLYLVIRTIYKDYGDEAYKMNNVGASLFIDYKKNYKYWVLVVLLYKIVVATIQTLANAYVPGLMLLLSFFYVGFAVLIFFLKPFNNKYNNWIEILNNLLSFIFSLLPVAAAFGANVPPLATTIIGGIETFISLAVSIIALILDKLSQKDTKKVKKLKDLEANEFLELTLGFGSIFLLYFSSAVFGAYFYVKWRENPTNGQRDLDIIPNNTCVFLEYTKNMDFFDTNNCKHLSEIKDSLEYAYSSFNTI